MIKIAYIGAGSLQFGPMIVQDIPYEQYSFRERIENLLNGY